MKYSFVYFSKILREEFDIMTNRKNIVSTNNFKINENTIIWRKENWSRIFMEIFNWHVRVFLFNYLNLLLIKVYFF